MIGPLLRLATTTVGARSMRAAAAEVATRASLGVAAGLGGMAALFCFSTAGLTLLERRLDPAEAWAVLGAVYGVAGGALYFATIRRRRG